jgi:hypothetical protein
MEGNSELDNTKIISIIYSNSGLSGIHPALQILQAYAKINIGEYNVFI